MDKKIIPLNINAAIDDYVHEMRAMKRSPNTIESYHIAFKHLSSWFGDKDLCAVTRSDIVRLMAALADELISPPGVARRPPKRRSNKTLKNYWIAWSALWTWAIKAGYAAEHVVRQVRPPKPEVKQVVPYTDAEIVAMVRACSRSNAWHNKPLTDTERYTSARDTAIILTLLDTGARNAELRHIQLVDIDFSENRVWIRNGKGKKDRVVSFGDNTRRALRRYLHTRPEQAASRGDYLFVSMMRYKGYQMSGNALTKLIQRIAMRAGVEKANIHRFRHTAAVNRLKHGLNVFQLQAFLGHAQVSTCMKYVHIANLDMDEAMQRTSPVDNLRL